jgi:hypothetical protein
MNKDIVKEIRKATRHQTDRKSLFRRLGHSPRKVLLESGFFA